MIYEYHLRLLLETADPFQQAILIRMSADACQIADLCVDLNFFSEELHFLRTLVDAASQRTDCLISGEENRALFSPQVVLQMMADPAGLTHAAGRKNHLRLRIEVDSLGVIARNRYLQAWEDQRVPAGIQDGLHLFIEIVIV